MHKIWLSLILLLTSSVALAAQSSDSCQDNSIFNVGAGIYDITGPAAEQRMMGYAMLDQKTEGLYSRLWARAFVIESPCNGKRIVFVNADLGQVFQAVKEQVVKKLQEKFGDRYSDQNVLITATHQHSGPGGYSTYTLYNLTILGFSKKNFDTIVDGIINAVERAQNNLTKAQIKIAKGSLLGISFNRSPQSYHLNPANERIRYTANVDTEMTLVRFDSLDGKPIGMINWFPLHGVSMNNKNHLINGDNKGYAEYLFEKDFHSDYGPTAFVAAFAQANAGDVSPNDYGHEGGQGLDGLKAVEKAGRPQYEFAKTLFNTAFEVVKGGVDYRHTFVEMDKVTIGPQYTDGQVHTTCPAAIGISMLAGTTDGEGVGKQGETCDEISKNIPGFICEMMTTSCQEVKPIALQTGLMKPYPWTPNILPFQMFKIGNLLIAAAPFEITTMSGRRIKETIAKALPLASKYHTVLSTLSNAYVQYMATYEEYQLQRYEGASTLFGPWSLAAAQQEYAMLTKALIKGNPVGPGPTPIDLLDQQTTLQTDVLFDLPPLSKKFGDVQHDVKSNYLPGDTVSVVFWGAHPKNDYRIQDTFLAVQKLEAGGWKTISQDRDWDTEYHWQRDGIASASSLVTIVWRMPLAVVPGQYRIVHFGNAKAFWDGAITSYVGYSSIFTVG